TDKIGDEILTLPLWSYMDEAIIERVANHIREFYGLGTQARLGSDSGRPLLRRVRRQTYEIPVEGFKGVRLRSVSTASPTKADVQRLTEWRNRNPKSFQTEFVANDARTEKWLTDSVGKDDTRLLFMIEDSKKILGYVGIAFIDWEKRT